MDPRIQVHRGQLHTVGWEVADMTTRGPVGDVGDGMAFAAVVGALADWLPPLAALLAIVWTAIRIYEWARVVLFEKPPRKGN